MPHSSVIETLARLRELYPQTSFIALGQTVFWDEPDKAIWRSLLDAFWPDAELIAGVHDTDFFAKTTALADTDAPYAMLPHNDGATRGLWSAAGELSSLFGSEDVPTKAYYESFGVPFARLAAAYPDGRNAFYDRETEAWGWRGIIHTGSEPPISHDVPLSEYGPALLEQLDWGFASSLDCIAPEARERCREYCREVKQRVIDFIASASPTAALTDLYRHLLPLFYRSLLGLPPKRLFIENSMSLFRFDPETASRPRFAAVDLFLDEKTRDTCVDAYNHAVAGGGMYTLDTFGEGALPFDVVVPGRGRGTLRVQGGEVSIDWRRHTQTLSCPERAADRASLAKLLQCELGPHVSLVGKAVSLIDMLAAEFIVVFHETASGYTPRTTEMNDAIRRAGIAIDLKPIVRLEYPTWDALAAAEVSTPFLLPDHLARAFDRKGVPIPASEFGARWRGVVDAQKAVLATLRETRKPRALFALFGQTASGDQDWTQTGDEYEAHLKALVSNAAECAELKRRIGELRDQIAEDTHARLHTERAKGEDFRASVMPLLARAAGGEDVADQIMLEANRRSRFYDATINACRDRIRAARREIRRLRSRCRAIERTDDMLDHRRRLARIATSVEMERLERIRDAYIVSHALPHTQARPSAWWLPLVDGSGKWFKAMAEGTRARLERV